MSVESFTPYELSYRFVLPGYPQIMLKSPSFTPLIDTGRNHFGFNGLFSELYFAGLPVGSVYTRKTEKSPVCRGHSQLSVSPPKFPTVSGGVPTSRTSVKRW